MTRVVAMHPRREPGCGCCPDDDAKALPGEPPWALWVTLARVRDAKDADAMIVDLIDQNIIWMENGFARVRRATGAIGERKRGHSLRAFDNQLL